MAHSDWHPDNVMLLQAMDGELAAEMAEAVRDHLYVCPACREQSEDLEHTLGQVSVVLGEEQERQLLALPSGRKDFRERLAALDREWTRRPFWQRAFRDLRHQYMWRAVALTGAAAVCVLLILFFYPERKMRTVSASDVLARASGVRTQEIAAAAPAVRQKMRIRVGGQEMTRTIFRDLRGRKQWDLWDGAHRPAKTAPAAAEALRQRLADSPIDWDDPLSPDSFSRWYVRHAIKERDLVSEESGVVSVQASADSGPVLRASLRLRAADYHPIGESLSFNDRQNVEISELEYEVLRDSRQLMEVASPASPPTVPQPARKNDDAVDAEMMALSILHNAGADLGGEIQVRSGQNRAVEVSGFAGTVRRRMELVAALAQVPGIVMKLKTVEDIAARDYGVPAGVGPSGLTTRALPLAEMLADRIPDPLEREAFAGKALDLSQTLLSHAFALSRLGDRYSPEAEIRLSESSRASLRKMAGDHVAIIRQTARELRQQMSTVLGEPEETQGETSPSGPWQDRRAALQTAARKVDAGLTALFTEGSASNASRQRKAAISEEIAQLEAMAGDMGKNIAAGISNQ